MKQIISILIVLLLCLSVFVGCEDEKHISMNDEDIHTEYAGVYLTLTSVDDSGEHKKLKAVWHNETNKEYTFGEDFYIEIFENDEWKSVMTEDMIVASIAHLLPAKATQEKTYSTEYFDLSKEGMYRIRCEFSPGDGKRYNTWVVFEVKDNATTVSESISGKRLPIEMTIAETLPSCVAFEYKDGEPYCFYGYDDDGKLYRVLWNNFDGLNEKDRIVVDHNDVIKTLSYDEYPDGGWTPQYEITAIIVFTINSTGTRIYDAYHPDDSERYPHFSVTLAALNNAKVEYREDSKIYVDGEYLLGDSGNGCNSFYLSDLTGDGVPELCFGMNFGSGIVDQQIEIVDYATKETLFSLSDRGTNDYYLFLRNGILCVKETEYMKHDAVRTGVLTYNGSEISVAWDSEVNATVDRDNSPAPGEPVS